MWKRSEARGRNWQCAIRVALLTATVAFGSSVQAHEFNEHFSLEFVLAGMGQCQILSERAGVGDVCGGALPVHSAMRLRPTENDEIFVRAGFAVGNGLNGEAPFTLRPWAAYLQDDVEGINGRWDYLLNAWYKHEFRFRDDISLAFTVGVIDDVMGTSLPPAEVPDIFEDSNVRQGRIVAYGSDCTVSMVKSATEIYSQQANPDSDAEGLFAASTAEYDSRKAGGVTVSHLRVATGALDESFEVRNPDYVAVHHPALLHKRDGILKGIRDGGIFVINTADPVDIVFASDLALKEAQIIQQSLDRVLVRVVPAAGFDSSAEARLARSLRERLGPVDVRFERLDRIPRGPGGKFKVVSSELRPLDRPGDS